MLQMHTADHIMIMVIFSKLLNSLRVLNSSLHSLEKAIFHTKNQFLKLPKKLQFYKERISYTYAKKLKLLIIDVC